MKLIHICEGCGKREELTPEESYQQGWDYPPNIGVYGVVSPRTCGDCVITKTLYWRVINSPKVDGAHTYQPTEEEMVLVKRILGEPESIQVRE